MWKIDKNKNISYMAVVSSHCKFWFSTLAAKTTGGDSIAYDQCEFPVYIFHENDLMIARALSIREKQANEPEHNADPRSAPGPEARAVHYLECPAGYVCRVCWRPIGV